MFWGPLLQDRLCAWYSSPSQWQYGDQSSHVTASWKQMDQVTTWQSVTYYCINHYNNIVPKQRIHFLQNKKSMTPSELCEAVPRTGGSLSTGFSPSLLPPPLFSHQLNTPRLKTRPLNCCGMLQTSFYLPILSHFMLQKSLVAYPILRLRPW